MEQLEEAGAGRQGLGEVAKQGGGLEPWESR